MAWLGSPRTARIYRAQNSRDLDTNKTPILRVPGYRPAYVPEVVGCCGHPKQSASYTGTIERPRVRARLADQGERARPPWDGRRHDPMPPSSPGETSAGPLKPSEAVEPGEAGGDEGRQRRKRHQQRGKRPHRPSHDARETSKRTNQRGSEPWEDGG